MTRRDDMLALRGKKVLVMGLGVNRGGLGVARFLCEQGAQVTVTDLRTPDRLAPSLEELSRYPIRYVLGEHRLQDFQNADIVVRNPAVPRQSMFLSAARESGAAVEMEMTLFFRLCPAPIIGITGTKGKTTTTMLTGEMLKQDGRKTVVAGNLRVSALESLSSLDPDSWVVLELSSWQLEGLAEAGMSPHIAVVTNIYPDHLDRYKDMEDYVAAKKAIFLSQSPADVLILNSDDHVVREFALEAKGSVRWFGVADPECAEASLVVGTDILLRWNGLEEVVCPVSAVGLPGKGNLLNVLAAMATVGAAGVSVESMARAVKVFGPVPDRLEPVAERAGITYYNDTTSTTPASTLAALEALGCPVVLIAGGSDKHLDFQELARAIVNRVSALVLLAGSATPRLRAEIVAAGWRREIPEALSMEEAVQLAHTAAQPGGAILLSPACASFGMFANEFERGELFRRFVREIAERG
ncbi:MAG: UDP-N-acetylmuramoyl-L-alanine--D-glutamate ligase [Chloroflexi bacterium]|nr:UDP-N-acetylmuramoyl-L-alanine--D-glutamate ligase [Chloroflexota bacterium]